MSHQICLPVHLHLKKVTQKSFNLLLQNMSLSLWSIIYRRLQREHCPVIIFYSKSYEHRNLSLVYPVVAKNTKQSARLSSNNTVCGKLLLSGAMLILQISTYKEINECVCIYSILCWKRLYWLYRETWRCDPLNDCTGSQYKIVLYNFPLHRSVHFSCYWWHTEK